MTTKTVMSAGRAYQSMLSTQVTPALRDLGLVLEGQGVFRLPDDHTHVLVAFQKSRHSDASRVEFTINLCVVRHRDWDYAREMRVYLPEIPEAGPPYPVGWQSRIGHLLPAQRDYWWSLTPGADTQALATEVVAAVREFALPPIQERLGR